MVFSIKQITPEKTHDIRHPILRAEKPIETCVFDGDHLKTTFHFGIFLEEKLLGVCSFFKNNHAIFKETCQYQLRGMAILKPYQSQGFGHAILKHGEQALKANGTQRIWCNARVAAVNFYKNNGYKIDGKPFNIEQVGIHYLMHKVV